MEEARPQLEEQVANALRLADSADLRLQECYRRLIRGGLRICTMSTLMRHCKCGQCQCQRKGQAIVANSRTPGVCDAFEAEEEAVVIAHGEALGGRAFTVPTLQRETDEEAVRRLAVALETPTGSWQQETLARGGPYAPPRERAIAMINCAIPTDPQLPQEDGEEAPMEMDKEEEEATQDFFDFL